MVTLAGRKCHVSYSVSGATRLLRRLGFRPQVPARRGDRPADRRPSRSERERVVPMPAELFHAIAQIIRRLTRDGRPVQLPTRYDGHEKTCGGLLRARPGSSGPPRRPSFRVGVGAGVGQVSGVWRSRPCPGISAGQVAWWGPHRDDLPSGALGLVCERGRSVSGRGGALRCAFLLLCVRPWLPWGGAGAARPGGLS
ncbi:winged helix-turn-helix domain-containing protein [Kitasatospora herbaricolor]|uniref:helix-turn-helix domain-containing protein n=1 Tax=Kitasatospora herbaricolor TaxID=68217 RepID=UPI0036DB3B32